MPFARKRSTIPSSESSFSGYWCACACRVMGVKSAYVTRQTPSSKPWKVTGEQFEPFGEREMCVCGFLQRRQLFAVEEVVVEKASGHLDQLIERPPAAVEFRECDSFHRAIA